MRFATIADLHLSKYSQDKIEDSTNLPERLSSIKESLYEVAHYCRNNGIKYIVDAGDTLHNKSIIYATAQNIMLQYFKDFPDLFFVVIDGNHDLSGKGDDVVSALQALDNLPMVKWVRHDTIYRMDSEGILFIPYSYNLPKIIKENKSRILISHFGLNEGVLNSGVSVIADISLKDLTGRYELVELGHYHKPQEIINDQIKLYYVGSLIQLDWGEKGDQKRFLVTDTDTLQVDSIPISSYKKHIEIEVTTDNKDEAIKNANVAKKNGDHVKVILKEKVDISKEIKDIVIIDKTQSDITNRGITSSMSQEDRLRKFLEIKEINEADIYLSVAKEIIDSCEG